MARTLKLHRNEMLLMVVALGLIFVVTAGLIVTRLMRTEWALAPALSGGETASPITRQQQPLPAPPVEAQTPPSQPQQEPPRTIISEKGDLASRPSAESIDPKAVENAFTTLAQDGKQRNLSPQRPPASSAVSAESDRYPGSQPIEVKDVNLPDIGVPVSSEVYTTSDSLSTVVVYYMQRYPDAEVVEVNGQKVIAIERPGATRVIAIGSSGEETRIAIVKQAN
jgi:hypothetical protein